MRLRALSLAAAAAALRAAAQAPDALSGGGGVVPQCSVAQLRDRRAADSGAGCIPSGTQSLEDACPDWCYAELDGLQLVTCERPGAGSCCIRDVLAADGSGLASVTMPYSAEEAAGSECTKLTRNENCKLCARGFSPVPGSIYVTERDCTEFQVPDYGEEYEGPFGCAGEASSAADPAGAATGATRRAPVSGASPTAAVPVAGGSEEVADDGGGGGGGGGGSGEVEGDGEGSGGVSVTAIAAGVAGGTLILLAVLAALLCFCCRRRRKDTGSDEASKTPAAAPPSAAPVAVAHSPPPQQYALAPRRHPRDSQASGLSDPLVAAGFAHPAQSGFKYEPDGATVVSGSGGPGREYAAAPGYATATQPAPFQYEPRTVEVPAARLGAAAAAPAHAYDMPTQAYTRRKESQASDFDDPLAAAGLAHPAQELGRQSPPPR